MKKVGGLGIVSKYVYVVLCTISLFFFVAFSISNISFVTAFEFNGSVFDVNGTALSGVIVNVTILDATIWTGVTSNSTTTNGSGWFNISIGNNNSQMYKAVISMRNTTLGNYNFTTYIGQSLPAFPNQMFSMLSNMKFYLRSAGTINVTAVNGSGSKTTFFYQIKDMKLGYPIASEFQTYQSEVNIIVPADRNYSVLIYPNQSLPLSFEWNNFSSSLSYILPNNTATNGSRYNATTLTIHKQFNTSIGMVRVSGFLNASADLAGWNTFGIVPYLFEPGSIVHARRGAMLYNMSAFVGGSDTFNFTSGRFNISLPSAAETLNFLLFASGRNGSRYFGGFINLSLTQGVSPAEQQRNISMNGLLGSDANISLDDAGNSSGKFNVTTKKQVFNLVNATNSSLSNVFAHIEVKLDYTSFGASQFTFLDNIEQGGAANFSLPLINTTGIKSMNIYVGGGGASNFAPKRATLSVTDILSKTSSDENRTNITISGFNPGAIDAVMASNSITMTLYFSNSTCDVPYPPIGCIVGGTGAGGGNHTMEDFNPMSAMMGGGKLSFRMGTGNISIHYVNVDMMASGPPDALFDNSTSSSTGSTFDSAVRFGSGGPSIYDFVIVSMPYSDTAGSGLDESLDINLSIPVLYDDNWKVIWNASVNGTNVSALSGNNSYYKDRQSEWQSLMTANNCSKNDASGFNASRPCFINTTDNKIWIRLPHFSGTGPSVKGAVKAVASSSSSSSSSGGGGGKTVTAWKETFVVTGEQFKSGFTRGLAASERLKVTIATEAHYVGVLEMTKTSAKIRVESEAQEITLNVGETKKFELSGDDYYDVSVTLESIKDNKASIKVKEINEKVAVQQETTGGEGEKKTIPAEKAEVIGEPTSSVNSVRFILGVVIGIVVLVLIVMGVMRRKQEKLRRAVKIAFSPRMRR